MRTQSHPQKKLNDAPEYGSIRTDWGKFPVTEEDSIDHHTVDYCIDRINLNQTFWIVSCIAINLHALSY